ncbi:MAG: ferritin-like domain-containing protein [Chitinophagales bacterium]|nr:ferritin-like domain-containing protein [Chitinophagales bacterium]
MTKPKLIKAGGQGMPHPLYASRRRFLAYAGFTVAGTTLLLSSCKDDDDDDDDPLAVNLGSGDVGILNYAYALEQLEAAFYTQVVATPYSGISSMESQIMNDLKNHEVAHRDFLKAALGSNAIQDLQVNFSSIDFNSRSSVLGAAKTFEDLGVAAYNGAGKLLQSADYLLIAGKIVSVEARHAAAIRSILDSSAQSFAGDDVVTASNGLDRAMVPADVLQAAADYLTTELNGSNLPQ